MEGTEEAFERARQTRNALKRSRPGDEAGPSKTARVSTGKAHNKVPNQRSKACTHTVAVPESFDRSSITLDPATHGTLEDPKYDVKLYRKKYEFELDPFQYISVACLERDESVMVAAHTSAGKTAIAEYAVAKALQAGQRVLYTSPLKALSNQKFRELQEEFQDVGLMTGDVSINPEASCIVMTTEILRSMVYRGSEMLREIAWVIFDEIHYMQDRKRGVVWEETIISLPRACRMVFLSATLSNAQEFAEWVASLHRQPCHVVFTDYRPTPLEHFALPCLAEGKDQKKGGLYKVCSKDGKFSTKMWQELHAEGAIQAAWADEGKAEGAEGGGKEAGADGADAEKGSWRRPKRDQKFISEKIVDVLRLAEGRGMYPMIIFSFVRKECEVFAMTAWHEGEKHGGLDFTTAEEKATIETVFQNAVESLGEDVTLPAVQNIKRYLLKGIGIHHGGLIPLVKELVEILFQESLVKVLFATETFAMGLNMPARAVVFTAWSKSDGVCRSRPLTSGEYIQMSGRAGRRGKDDRGYCIVMVEDADTWSPAVARGMILGAAMPLVSKFKLSYYTLLNLTKRSEGGLGQMEFLIAHSFQQFQHEKAMPVWKARLAELEAALANPDAAGLSRATCEEYVRLRTELGRQEAIVHERLTQPATCLPFLSTGRLVRIREGTTDWGWGIVLQTLFRPPLGPSGQDGSMLPPEEAAALKKLPANWQLIVMLPVHGGSKADGAPVPAAPSDPDAELIPIPVPLALVVGISKDRVTLPTDVRPSATRELLLKTLDSLVNTRFKGPAHVPMLHPVADMAIREPAVAAALERVALLSAELSGNLIYQKETGSAADAAVFQEYKALAMEREALAAKVSRSQLQDFKTQVTQRRRVLRKLGHLTAEGMLTAKGKAAAEIDTADELMTTELMFNAVWKTLDTPQLVALLSCLVPCNEKELGGEEGTRIPLQLAGAVSTLQDFAGTICDVTNECGLELDKEQYVMSFTPNLMVPLYAWAKGATFREVTEKTSIYEGTLIRCARRLMELMNQIIYAAEKVGEQEMQAQMEAALASLQRGIMFYGSLYL